MSVVLFNLHDSVFCRSCNCPYLTHKEPEAWGAVEAQPHLDLSLWIVVPEPLVSQADR
jgi:hypothetical protein